MGQEPISNKLRNYHTQTADTRHKGQLKISNMDLVDIDKVLDDFELHEDQRPSDHSGVHVVAATNADKRSVDDDAGRKSQQPQGRPVTSKTFVNVSNVFHSLNEYVNADCRAAIDKNNRSSSEISKFVKLDMTTDDSMRPVEPSSTNNDSSPVIEVNKAINTSDSRVFPDDELSLVANEHPVAVDCSESPDSICENRILEVAMVSSDSTFSSSQSLSSTTPPPEKPPAAAIFQTDPETDSVAGAEQMDLSRVSTSSERALITSPSLDADVVNATNSSENRPDKEAIAIGDGLSSVSSLCLHDNTVGTSSSASFSNDDDCVVMADDTFSLSSSFRPLDEDRTTSETPAPPQPPLYPHQTAIVEPFPIQPIGFESTMDDVSDTELESYLQDLELEPSLSQLGQIETVATQCYEAAPDTADLQPQEPTEVPDEDPPDGSIVDMNVDSISLASTVEYVENRLSSDFEQPSVPEPCAEPPPSGSNNNENDDAKHYEQPLQRPDSLDIPGLMTTTSQPQDLSPNPPESLSADMTPSELAPPPPPPPEAHLQSSTGYDEASMDPVSSVPHDPFPTPSTLGKVQPYWIPDSVTNCCMQCNVKFSLIKRRHHCRACGQVLCSTCCSLKARLEYMRDVDARICVQCEAALLLQSVSVSGAPQSGGTSTESSSDGDFRVPPNPNNPMEYCSQIPPLLQQQQVATASAVPISVMVPVGVLKREGATRNRKEKQVMFSDGIRPGCDLTDLDNWDGGAAGAAAKADQAKRLHAPPGGNIKRVQTPTGQILNKTF